METLLNKYQQWNLDTTELIEFMEKDTRKQIPGKRLSKLFRDVFICSMNDSDYPSGYDQSEWNYVWTQFIICGLTDIVDKIYQSNPNVKLSQQNNWLYFMTQDMISTIMKYPDCLGSANDSVNIQNWKKVDELTSGLWSKNGDFKKFITKK